ncbi:MAG: hypothetical protein ABFS56_22550 [Pseudomonadota bacterium]
MKNLRTSTKGAIDEIDHILAHFGGPRLWRTLDDKQIDLVEVQKNIEIFNSQITKKMQLPPSSFMVNIGLQTSLHPPFVAEVQLKDGNWISFEHVHPAQQDIATTDHLSRITNDSTQFIPISRALADAPFSDFGRSR